MLLADCSDSGEFRFCFGSVSFHSRNVHACAIRCSRLAGLVYLYDEILTGETRYPRANPDPEFKSALSPTARPRLVQRSVTPASSLSSLQIFDNDNAIQARATVNGYEDSRGFSVFLAALFWAAAPFSTIGLQRPDGTAFNALSLTFSVRIVPLEPPLRYR